MEEFKKLVLIIMINVIKYGILSNKENSDLKFIIPYVIIIFDQ